jgi:competence protein ComEA
MLGVRLAQPTVSDRATSPARVAASTERIDPNTAGPESLRRLPNLGPTRVNAIIAYRQTNGPVPFRNAADLTKVHGIGPTIAASLDEYLEFPEQP